MSNVANFEKIYVGDLDAYISIDGINAANIREEEDGASHALYEQMGSIELLAGKSLSPFSLNRRHISPADWQWELYRARRYLRGLHSWRSLEPLLLRHLLSSGRAYAVRRYAKAERISFAAAMTAALPHGMQALMSQFLAQHGLCPSREQSHRLSAAWRTATAAEDLTAYSKTGRMRLEIVAIAEDAWGRDGATGLSREATRQILSLTRLHFSVAEMKNGGFSKFSRIEALYDAERSHFLELESSPGFTGIRNWRQRHLRSLLFYYPFAFRQAVARGRRQAVLDCDRDLSVHVTHEIALSNFAMTGIQRSKRGQ